MGRPARLICSLSTSAGHPKAMELGMICYPRVEGHLQGQGQSGPPPAPCWGPSHPQMYSSEPPLAGCPGHLKSRGPTLRAMGPGHLGTWAPGYLGTWGGKSFGGGLQKDLSREKKAWDSGQPSTDHLPDGQLAPDWPQIRFFGLCVGVLSVLPDDIFSFFFHFDGHLMRHKMHRLLWGTLGTFPLHHAAHKSRGLCVSSRKKKT